MKLKYFVFLAVLFTGVWSNAQQQIKGSIIDSKNNPVPDVVVRLADGSKYTVSDSSGSFEIYCKRGQKATLSHIGYNPVDVVLDDGIIVVMYERPVELSNIVVKANPFEAIAQSDVIIDDIKSITQPRNVSDLFRDIPGFGIQKRGAYASEPVFRAFRYEQLNVMYDGGMKTMNACPNRMDPITTHIIPEEIEKIEIIRGPFTMRFGSNFGGIINLVTKSGNQAGEGLSGNLETGFESNGNNFTGRGTVFYKKGKFDLELNGSYRNYGNYTDGNGTEVPSSFKTTDYSVKLGIDPTENQRLKLTWRQSFGRDIMHAGLMMDSPYDDSYLIGIDYGAKNLSNTISGLTVKGFYSYVDHLMTNDGRPSFMMTEASSNVFATTYGGKAELVFKPNEQIRIFAGADANLIARDGSRIRKIKVMNGNPLPEPKIKVDKIWQDSQLNDYGLYAEGKYLLNEQSTFTAGIRSDFVKASINDPEADFLELYGGEIADQNEVNISATLSYIYNAGHSSWQFAWGRGVRTAAMIERFINHFNVGVDPYEYVGNPYLDPEANNQFEVSYAYKNKNFDFGTSVFYANVSNYITAVVDESLPRKFMPSLPPKYAKRFINVDRAMQTGIEAYFNFEIIKDLRFMTDLAYTYGQNKDFDEPLPQVPPLSMHFGLNFEKEKYWLNLKTRVVAQQSRISESFMETETPGFTTLDFSAGVTLLKGLNIGGAVLNIFDTAYYEHLNFSYKNSNLLQGRIYEPGRNFTVSVNYTF